MKALARVKRSPSAEAEAPLRVRWTSPFLAAAYDRSALTKAERAALTRMIRQHNGTGGRYANADIDTVRRLLEPMYDLITHVGGNGKKGHRRTRIISPLVRAMRARGTTFWRWDISTWVEIVDSADRSERQSLCLVAYLLCDLNVHHRLGVDFKRADLAFAVFTKARVEASRARIRTVLEGWGYIGSSTDVTMPLTWAMLEVRSPELEDITTEVLNALRDHPETPGHVQQWTYTLSRALAHLGIIPSALAPRVSETGRGRSRSAEEHAHGVPAEWAKSVARWHKTSTYPANSRNSIRNSVLRAGRWLAANHPEVVEPGQWTSEVAAGWIAAVNGASRGDWSLEPENVPHRGQPIGVTGKIFLVNALRWFFRDLSRWRLVRNMDMDPAHDLSVPSGWRRLIGPNPREVRAAVWMKLVWASLNLTDEDTAHAIPGRFRKRYPPEFVRAVAVVWTHAGLRGDELVRLRVGCMTDIPVGTDDALAAELGTDVTNLVSYLHVPVNKTSTEFTKPVGKIVATVIGRWEVVRSTQPLALDKKTGEMVHFLFSHRAGRMSKWYLNHCLIPMLCKKAGVPMEDVPGKRITSHRGRASAATWYYNTREGMTLEELHRWLGHKSLASTQHYVRTSPLKQARAFARAHKSAYLAEVVVDIDAVQSGAAANGAPWQFFALGKGDYCTNPFYSACKHRLACAKCDHYADAEGQAAQALAAKGHLQRMLVEMPLSEEELMAVEEGVEVFDRLVAKLQDVPTPSGQTPRELAARPGRSDGTVSPRRSLPILGG